MKEKLKEHIIGRFGKEPPHLEQVVNAFKEINTKRRDVVLLEGEICTKIYFVVEGCLQIEATDEKGDKNILGFVFENNWYTVMESFQKRIPAKESILATESSACLVLEKKLFEKLKIEIPEFSLVYGQILEEHYGAFMERINTLMTLDATERVKWFLEKHPSILNRLNSNTISNYLKIRPETFSRIKAKIFNS